MTEKAATPSRHPGMGPLPYEGGVAFRVWAPQAQAVSVVGTFNDWADHANPLAEEEGGYWSADVPGAKPGDQYKYVISTHGELFDRADPYARALTYSRGNSIVHNPDFDWGDDGFRMPSWNELVIYEMHIGTFNPRDGKPGTFDGAIEKMPYLQELGINAVEVMPVTEFRGGFSWGYDVAHPFAVESQYGGPEGLKRFVKAAHQHGIAVILDAVYNHWGPSDNALWQFDGWSENAGGGIYFYNDYRAKTPWGDTRPDYSRPEVHSYIRDNYLMWLEEYRADGLRVDATAYIRGLRGELPQPAPELPEGWTLLQEMNGDVRSRHPWKLTIAEDLKGDPRITRSPEEGGAGFGAQWDTGFTESLRNVICGLVDEDRRMADVKRHLETRRNDDAFQRVIFTESHDAVANGDARLPEEISPGQAESWYPRKRSTLGAALVLTAPGIPMLFQGQELLEDKWFHVEDPIDWSRLESFKGIVHMYRDLIGARRNLAGTTQGLKGQNIQVCHVNEHGNLLAFHRWDEGGPGDSTMVVINLADRNHQSYTIGFPQGGLWKVRFNGDWQGYDPEFGLAEVFDTTAESGDHDCYHYHGNVAIGPYSVVILSQDRL